MASQSAIEIESDGLMASQSAIEIESDGLMASQSAIEIESDGLMASQSAKEIENDGLNWDPDYMKKVAEELAPSLLQDWILARGPRMADFGRIFQPYLNPLMSDERCLHTRKKIRPIGAPSPQREPAQVAEKQTVEILPYDLSVFLYMDNTLRETMRKDSQFTRYLYTGTTLLRELSLAITKACNPFGKRPRRGLVPLIFEELFYSVYGIKAPGAIMRERIKLSREKVWKLYGEKQELKLKIRKQSTLSLKKSVGGQPKKKSVLAIKHDLKLSAEKNKQNGEPIGTEEVETPEPHADKIAITKQVSPASLTTLAVDSRSCPIEPTKPYKPNVFMRFLNCCNCCALFANQDQD